MSNNTSPVSPMPLSQHFSDYGFDPQIDYFQVLEEARKHKKETSSIDSMHQFKLQKPISKDDLIRTALHKKKKRWFLKTLCSSSAGGNGEGETVITQGKETWRWNSTFTWRGLGTFAPHQSDPVRYLVRFT
ncbi:hypothetical protein Bca52824_068182 [Brassica carinata]|uniref:Uncharacterized protein n=1 Tax=Brassica carinata TaxID=52824 RepID=A0A8X7Q1C2_BRACI|nr:hypothetical protein Bca52824_068182 [Brassica carinata]